MQQRSTDIFTVGAGPYVSASARRLLARWWWIAAVPVLALAIAGTFDSRYLYLCLMLIFVIYPSALAMTWIALAGKTSMRWCPRPQHIEENKGETTLVFHKYEPEGEGDDATRPELARLDIPAPALAEARRGNSLTTITLDRNNEFAIPFLLIPTEIYDSLSASKSNQ